MKILVTGGTGYVGSVLVPVLAKHHDWVTAVDVGWFNLGGTLNAKGDFRELTVAELAKFDVVIHLAAVANDPSAELNPELTWKTNALGTMRLAERCAEASVRQFIYASSGSVYGVSDAPEVTEDTPKHPLSAYNETKMVAERAVLSYRDRMHCVILRPGTVCGVSPRLRLDVVVNQFVIQALIQGVITVQGGEQMRPLVHIKDMARAYLWALEWPPAGVYNVSCCNMSVGEIAETVAALIPGCRIEYRDTTDPRSYCMNSDRIRRLGFEFKHTVREAILDMCEAFKRGELKDEPRCYNVQWMRDAMAQPN